MDNESPSNPETPPSELGAYEAIEAKPDADMITCPVCGRSVEKGFRFCDGCGSRLEEPAAAPPLQDQPPPPPAPEPPVPPAPDEPPPAVPDAEKESLLERLQRRRAERERVARADAQTERVSFFERLKRRRTERSELAEAERTLFQGPPRLDATPEVIDLPDAPARPVGATSRPVPAEELRGARPAMGGRLQWSEEGTSVQDAPPSPGVEEQEDRSPWLPRAIPTQAQLEGRTFRPALFALYVGIAFLAGAIVLGVITVVATLASDGSVALLPKRGLPIFIGGVVSVLVFALLSSGRRSPSFGASRSSTITTTIAGLAILVVLAAIAYQPGIAARIQPRIDRALGVFSGDDEEAVTSFQQDIREWNEDSDQYHALLEASLRRGIDFNRFRQRAADFEGRLVDLIAQMRAHADAAQNADIRDGLDDLASIYEDQLGGLRIVNRGILIDGLNLVRTGDRRYKDARQRAGTLYSSRLRPLLVRAGYDAKAFGDALGD
jgi:hypothetical protein